MTTHMPNKGEVLEVPVFKFSTHSLDNPKVIDSHPTTITRAMIRDMLPGPVKKLVRNARLSNLNRPYAIPANRRAPIFRTVPPLDAADAILKF